MKIIKILVIIIFLALSPTCAPADVPLFKGDVFIASGSPVEPYTVKNGNIISGSTVETIKILFKMAGVSNYKFIMQPYARNSYSVTQPDGVHMWFAPANSPEECHVIQYKGLSRTDWGFFVLDKGENSLKYDSFEDLRDKRIGYIIKYVLNPDLKEFMIKNAKLRLVGKHAVNFKKLKEGHLDYTICDVNIGRYMSEKVGVKTKFLTNKMAASCEHHMVFNPHLVSYELVEKIRKAQETEQFQKKQKEICKKLGIIQLDFSDDQLKNWFFIKARPHKASQKK